MKNKMKQKTYNIKTIKDILDVVDENNIKCFLAEIRKEFDEKVKELNTTQDFTISNEGKIYEFGYKVLREDEIFTVVDFGNIKKFLEQSIEKAYQSGIAEGIKIQKDVPMGISNWENHGKKYQYDKFLEKKIFTEYKAKSKIGLSSLLGEAEKIAYAKGKKEAEEEAECKHCGKLLKKLQ